MLAPGDLRFRAARPIDTHAIARLHADSWQRRYRGAYADAFLDSDLADYLLLLWTEHLSAPHPRARTILAEARRRGRGTCAHSSRRARGRSTARRRPCSPQRQADGSEIYMAEPIGTAVDRQS